MDKRRCLYNNDNSACSFGSWISLIGLSMSCVLIICEAKFLIILSIRVRQRAILLDLGFPRLNTNTNQKILKVCLQDYGVSHISFDSYIC